MAAGEAGCRYDEVGRKVGGGDKRKSGHAEEEKD
jgi:hypothetical protein